MEIDCMKASRRYGKSNIDFHWGKLNWGAVCRSNVTMCRIASKWDQIWLNSHRESWLATGTSKASYHIRRCYGIRGPLLKSGTFVSRKVSNIQKVFVLLRACIINFTAISVKWADSQFHRLKSFVVFRLFRKQIYLEKGQKIRNETRFWKCWQAHLSRWIALSLCFIHAEECDAHP